MLKDKLELGGGGGGGDDVLKIFFLYPICIMQKNDHFSPK